MQTCAYALQEFLTKSCPFVIAGSSPRCAHTGAYAHINRLHQVRGVRFTVEFAWRAMPSNDDGGIYRLRHIKPSRLCSLAYSVCEDVRKISIVNSCHRIAVIDTCSRGSNILEPLISPFMSSSIVVFVAIDWIETVSA